MPHFCGQYGPEATLPRPLQTMTPPTEWEPCKATSSSRLRPIIWRNGSRVLVIGQNIPPPTGSATGCLKNGVSAPQQLSLEQTILEQWPRLRPKKAPNSGPSIHASRATTAPRTCTSGRDTMPSTAILITQRSAFLSPRLWFGSPLMTASRSSSSPACVRPVESSAVCKHESTAPMPSATVPFGKRRLSKSAASWKVMRTKRGPRAIPWPIRVMHRALTRSTTCSRVRPLPPLAVPPINVSPLPPGAKVASFVSSTHCS
mmetsp:Transcript_119809/g.267466  ORF Transcript_119809/g.267466 Transcript_119809/m.267466 type:complete len:259 (-) Transcript_119809:308-1084(-)